MVGFAFGILGLGLVMLWIEPMAHDVGGPAIDDEAGPLRAGGVGGHDAIHPKLRGLAFSSSERTRGLGPLNGALGGLPLSTVSTPPR